MVTNFRFLKTLSSKDQLLINKSIILNYLRENPSASRAKIARDIGISAPTTSKIIDEFIYEGFVIELGKNVSTGGKKATKLGFNTKYGSVIARNIRLNNSDSKRLRLFGDIGWSLSQKRMLDIKAE